MRSTYEQAAGVVPLSVVVGACCFAVVVYLLYTYFHTHDEVPLTARHGASHIKARLSCLCGCGVVCVCVRDACLKPQGAMRTPRAVAVPAFVILFVLLYRTLFAQFESASLSSWSSSGRMANQHAVVSEIPPRPTWAEAQRFLHPMRHEPLDFEDGTAPVKAGPEAAVPVAEVDQPQSQPAKPTALAPSSEPAWMQPDVSGRALALNAPARAAFSRIEPRGTTVHFTFGTSVMMDFVKNWLHFVKKAGLQPYLIGAADLTLLKACGEMGAAAAGIIPELDVWTYKRKPKRAEVYEMKSDWGYIRHHKSDFLEMGLVKVAFLWELLAVGFNVLISDLDVVWLNNHWQRWMTHADPAHPAVPEAALIAAADVLVTTDGLDVAADARGGLAGMIELNTGVVYFRATKGARAMVQTWRKAMLRQKGRPDLTENVNDQSLFNQVVRGSDIGTSSWGISRWRTELLANNVSMPEAAVANLVSGVRKVHKSQVTHEPCLPGEGCAGVHFTYGTLPIRPFTGGHTWFNQNVQEMEGHELPQNEPITVHFTFQFGDTKDYPHGKRQRAREAALWAVDPPEYFKEGIFVALDGPTYDTDYKARVYGRFPEWSPQRHMFMDAPQRQAVRDLLGLSQAVEGIMVLPKLWCHCDRYWNFLTRCRMPMLPHMALPFGCPMDSLYDAMRWNMKKVRFREHTFLANPNVPQQMKDNAVTVTVAAAGEVVTQPITRTSVQLAHGTPLTEVKAAVLKANPSVRVIKIANADLRRLCRWLGSRRQQEDFNRLIQYILTESSRYCPNEDYGGYGAHGFDWQNPFTAYNCTWGFISPSPFPLDREQCAISSERASSSGGQLTTRVDAREASTGMLERDNSTTCPRQMLCDYNVLPDGRVTKPTTWCNIEGYNGMRPEYLPITRSMLAGMPGGRCVYPPGDVKGPGPGHDSHGHYVG